MGSNNKSTNSGFGWALLINVTPQSFKPWITLLPPYGISATSNVHLCMESKKSTTIYVHFCKESKKPATRNMQRIFVRTPRTPRTTR